MGSGYRILSLGFWVWGLGFRVIGFRVWGLRFRVIGPKGLGSYSTSARILHKDFLFLVVAFSGPENKDCSTLGTILGSHGYVSYQIMPYSHEI